MSNNSVKLHRVFTCSPDKVYRAFTKAGAYEAWLPPNGFVGKVQEMNAVVGGKYRMSFENFTTQSSHSFGGEYLELIPGELIKHTSQFEDPNMPDIMTTTITLKPVICGTEISIVQENISELIPVEMCYLGWQESLAKLKNLVEPNIPDA